MTEPTTFTYLKAKAEYCTTITGIKRAIYPAVGHPRPGDMPCILLFSNSPTGPNDNEHNSTGAMLTLRTTGQLLLANKGDIDKVIEQGDKLVDPVLRAFMYDDNGYNPAVDYINTHAGQIDFLNLAQWHTGDIRYAGHEYYGASFYWLTKWHVYPGGTP